MQGRDCLRGRRILYVDAFLCSDARGGWVGGIDPPRSVGGARRERTSRRSPSLSDYHGCLCASTAAASRWAAGRVQYLYRGDDGGFVRSP